jgi:hypothetical protein
MHTMKVATADLRTSTGTLAFAAGDEVPDHVLDSDLAKANGWPELVAGPKSRAAEEARHEPAQAVAKK